MTRFLRHLRLTTLVGISLALGGMKLQAAEEYVQEQVPKKLMDLLKPATGRQVSLHMNKILVITQEKGVLRAVLRSGADSKAVPIAIPKGSSPLLADGARDLLGFASLQKIYVLSRELKITRQFTTIKRAETKGVLTEKGMPVFLKHGYVDAIPWGPALPPPAGFALYDHEGKVLLAKDKDSGLRVEGLLRSSIITYRTSKKGSPQYMIYGFDGSKLAAVEMPEKKIESSTRLIAAEDGSHAAFVCARFGRGFALKVYNSSGKQVLATENKRHMGVRFCGSLLVGIEKSGKQACAVHLYGLTGKRKAIRVDMKLAEDFPLPSAELGVFPGKGPRLLLLLQTVSAAGKRHVTPRVIDYGTGKELWAGESYKPKYDHTYFIGKPVPWEAEGLFTYDKKAGLAVIKRKKEGPPLGEKSRGMEGRPPRKEESAQRERAGADDKEAGLAAIERKQEGAPLGEKSSRREDSSLRKEESARRGQAGADVEEVSTPDKKETLRAAGVTRETVIVLLVSGAFILVLVAAVWRIHRLKSSAST